MYALIHTCRPGCFLSPRILTYLMRVKVNGKNKQVGKKKGKAGKKAKAKAAGAAVAPAHTANAAAPAPETNAELLGPEANDIIAAYTDV